MIGMPFTLKGNKGVFEFGKISTKSLSSSSSSVEKENNFSSEPTSVLDSRTSPSTPTSTSTLSSSFCGGSADTASVAAISDNNHIFHQKWPPTHEDISAEPPSSGAGGFGNRKDVWVSELQSIPAGLGLIDHDGGGGGDSVTGCGGLSTGNWDMLSEQAAPSEFEGNAGFGMVDSGLGFQSAMAGAVSTDFGSGSTMSMNLGCVTPSPSSFSDFNKMPPRIFTQTTNPSSNQVFSAFHNPHLPYNLSTGLFSSNQQIEVGEEKPQIFNPQLLINQNENQKNLNFVPLSFPHQHQDENLFPRPKRHQVERCHIQKPTFQSSPYHLQHLPSSLLVAEIKPKVDEVFTIQQHQPQTTMVDKLFQAAELIETGSSILAQGILARLNHQLSQPVGKPLQRAAFYFKEALLQLLINGTSNSPKTSSPIDVVLKIGAYKTFSEISPLLQFSNFTCNQALLEALDGFDEIHIIDFDIGIGGQWASFMQEISMKMGGAPSLRITAFTSQSSNENSLELSLTREHLIHFANDLGISFEIDIVNLDSLDSSSWSLPFHITENEVLAVNLPIGFSSIDPSSIPSLLCLIKQLAPKIIVSVDRGCDRSDLPFAHYLLQSLQAYSILFDSLDATNANPDVINKIERFLLQPRIESTIVQRHRSQETLPPWRNLFASAGLFPLTFSNFTETQAECLIKRVQGRGFHVDKRQASLVLCYQRRELVSVSAWRC